MKTDVVRAVIADDERAARDAIALMLSARNDVHVEAEAGSVAETVARVQACKPELLFLDIEMPDGTGFDVLEKLNGNLPRGVVFVTAHDEYAVRAFEVHALDYLLKPFGRQRFNQAVDRALERLRSMDALSLPPTLAAIRRVSVKSGSKTLLLDVGNIRWIEGADDYVRVHTADKSYLVDERLSAFEKQLDSREFLRVHRSCIVRIDCVEELHRESDGGGVLLVRGGVRLRVARSRWQDVEHHLRHV